MAESSVPPSPAGQTDRAAPATTTPVTTTPVTTTSGTTTPVDPVAVASSADASAPGEALRTGAYVGWSLAGAAALSYTTFALLGRQAEERLLEVCLAGGERICADSEFAELTDERESYALAANVSLGAGLVALVAGTAAYFIAPSEARDDRPAVTARTLKGGGMLTYSGQF